MFIVDGLKNYAQRFRAWRCRGNRIPSAQLQQKAKLKNER